MWIKHSINYPKVIISVIWPRDGIMSISILPSKQNFNKSFHCDNARPHLANEDLEKLGMKRLENLPYGLDLAPSVFFSFLSS